MAFFMSSNDTCFLGFGTKPFNAVMSVVTGRIVTDPLVLTKNSTLSPLPTFNIFLISFGIVI